MIRLGPHRMSGRADGPFRDYVQQVRPNVVKFLDPSGDDEALAAWCRQFGTEVIGRIYFDPQELGAGGGRQIQQVMAAARRFPSIRLWELHNEAWQAGDELSRYSELSIEFMRQMDSLGTGQKAVIGCFSVGMPDLPEGDSGAQWRRYAPALRHAAEHGHYLGLHQYGGGSRGMRFAPTWYALRHRLVLAWANGERLPMPKILITESGIDHLEQADIKTRGWRTMPAGYDYAADMLWLCQALSDDPLVAGVVDFGWAAIDPQWSAFDLAAEPAMTLRMITEMRALSAQPPPKEKPVADLHSMLASAFGPDYSDLRYTLPHKSDGPNGDFGIRAWKVLDTLAVHHTVGPRDQQWNAIAQTHIDQRKFAGIGYHMGIRQGKVALFSDPGIARACCENQNHRVLCVAITGNYETSQLTPEDAAALRKLAGVVQHWAELTLGRRLRVLGHKEVPGQATACPGKHLLPLVRELAGGAPVPLPPPAQDLVPLVAEVNARHKVSGITFNPNGALQRAIQADGLAPTTREMELSLGGVVYIAQRAESLSGGRATVYLVRKGDWSNVRKVNA